MWHGSFDSKIIWRMQEAFQFLQAYDRVCGTLTCAQGQYNANGAATE